MMLRNSQLMRTILQKVFPLAILYSIYLFSYGGAFPGGGFQAGVIIGTVVVIMELLFEERLWKDTTFERIECIGVLCLTFLAILGWILSGRPFGVLYDVQGNSLPFANTMIWVLSGAIYLEVAGSMVLVFRVLLFSQPALGHTVPHVPKKGNYPTWIVGATALMLVIFGVFFVITSQSIHTSVNELREHALMVSLDYNIQNLVSVVYLGPRMFDTLLEVLVVVLTVYGIRAIGEIG